jgi:hypothetical protein
LIQIHTQVRRKLMKINLFILSPSILWLFLCLLSGCGNSDSPLPVLSEKQLKEAIAQRMQQGKTKANDSDVLLGALPSKLIAFDSTFEKGSRLEVEKMSFAEASRNYFYPGDYSLIANLADYATDSTAFLHVFHRFKLAQADTLSTEREEVSVSGGFAWMWSESRSDKSIHHLEAGLGTRFHLKLQTNHPEGKNLLLEVLRKVKWEKIE